MNITMQVISSITSSFFFQCNTDSFTNFSHAASGLFYVQNGTTRLTASSLEINSQTPSDARIINLSSSLKSAS